MIGIMDNRKEKEMDGKTLSGGQLAGGNPKNGRVMYDYYATNPIAVKKLLQAYDFKGHTMLEPCVSGGHIANVMKEYYQNDLEVTGVDIVDRGYPNTIISNFLEWETDKRFEMIVTNPPYSLATEFAYKGLSLLTDGTDNTANGQMAMFLKIQFLEGEKREMLFRDYLNTSMFFGIGWRHGIEENR